MVTERVEPTGETFPAASVMLDETVHVPVVNPERAHDDAVAGSYVQVLVVPPLTAEIVTVSPATALEPENDGPVTFVMLSVDDDPASLDASRSGADAGGAVVSTVMDNAELDPDTFPAGSVNVPVTDHVPSVRPDNEHDVPDPMT